MITVSYRIRHSVSLDRGISRLAAAFFIIVFGMPVGVLAQIPAAPAGSIKGFYHHQAWTSKEGAPAGIWAFAQTPKGWLWVGSAAGLFRFDGATFERVDLRPANSVASRGVGPLFTTSHGTMWVGYTFGGATELSDGPSRQTRSPPGLAATDAVYDFAEDGMGNPWAMTSSGKAYVLKDAKWILAGPEWGLPPERVQQAVLDREGTLWFSTATGLFVLHKGDHRFERAKTDALVGATIGISRSGQMWKLDRNGLGFLGKPNESESNIDTPAPRSGSATILTRDGSLWTVECAAGVCRGAPGIGSGSTISGMLDSDRFTTTDGLSSDRAMELFEDREGNLWVGTKRGLDQFRRADLVSVNFPSPQVYFAMIADGSRGIWAGTDLKYKSLPDQLWRLDPLPSRVDEISAAITVAYPDSDGSIIFGGRNAAWRLSAGHRTPFTGPPPHENSFYQAIARDGEGRLWVSIGHSGLFRQDGEQWTRKGDFPNLPNSPASVLTLSDTGTLWLGFTNNRVFTIDRGRASGYTETDGLSTGTVTAILPGKITLVAGELALNAFDGRRFIALHAEQPEALTGISGMLRTADGSLWLNGNAGAVHISADDYLHAISDTSYVLPVHLFSSEDGMPGTAQQYGGYPTLVEDRQRRLWFAASDGLAWVDPQYLQHNPRPPPVEILSVSSPTRRYDADAAVILPAGTQSVQIAYTALSLTIPERVRFRAQLSGIDKVWREMNGQRTVEYANLSAGTYQFQVTAANNDGVWNDSGATFSFSIKPAFYQTLWFKLLCALATLAAIFGLVRVQSYRAASRVSNRMSERMKERERIARELHDTLIQDVEALALNLRALDRRFGKDNPAHLELLRLDNTAQESLKQARSRVGGLRGEGHGAEYPANALRELAETLSALYPAAFRVNLHGAARVLKPLAAEEIIAIGREAILNAFRHAQASAIVIAFNYKARTFELTVSDDGKGFDAGVSTTSGRGGHWGLIGMQERAKTLKAQLTTETKPGGGTKVVLRVSAAITYADIEIGNSISRRLFKIFKRATR